MSVHPHVIEAIRLAAKGAGKCSIKKKIKLMQLFKIKTK